MKKVIFLPDIYRKNVYYNFSSLGILPEGVDIIQKNKQILYLFHNRQTWQEESDMGIFTYDSPRASLEILKDYMNKLNLKQVTKKSPIYRTKKNYNTEAEYLIPNGEFLQTEAFNCNLFSQYFRTYVVTGSLDVCKEAHRRDLAYIKRAVDNAYMNYYGVCYDLDVSAENVIADINDINDDSRIKKNKAMMKIKQIMNLFERRKGTNEKNNTLEVSRKSSSNN